MKRRTVLKVGAALVITPLARGAEACDGHDDLAATSMCDKLRARIGRNHGHVFAVSLADVRAGEAKTYDLAGTSGHPHAVTVTADDFRRIRAGEAVRFASSKEGGHIHRLLVQCSPSIEPPERVNVCEIEVGGRDEHEFLINAEEMKAGVEKTYDIQGLSGHTHVVKVSAADFKDIAAGKQATIASSVTDGHTHYAYIRYPRKA